MELHGVVSFRHPAPGWVHPSLHNCQASHPVIRIHILLIFIFIYMCSNLYLGQDGGEVLKSGYSQAKRKQHPDLRVRLRLREDVWLSRPRWPSRRSWPWPSPWSRPQTTLTQISSTTAERTSPAIISPDFSCKMMLVATCFVSFLCVCCIIWIILACYCNL